MSDRNKYTTEINRNLKKQRTADDDPHAYAGADENSSDSDDEVSCRIHRRTFFTDKNVLYE